MKGQQVGEIGIGNNHGKRDAFHIPGMLVMSRHETLSAGQHVRFESISSGFVDPAGQHQDSHGVIDPFIKCPVMPGQTVWMFINPDIVSNLTHNFEIDMGIRNKGEYEYDECANCNN